MTPDCPTARTKQCQRGGHCHQPGAPCAPCSSALWIGRCGESTTFAPLQHAPTLTPSSPAEFPRPEAASQPVLGPHCPIDKPASPLCPPAEIRHRLGVGHRTGRAAERPAAVRWSRPPAPPSQAQRFSPGAPPPPPPPNTPNPLAPPASLRARLLACLGANIVSRSRPLHGASEIFASAANLCS